MIAVGTAGWATPRAVAHRFPAEGSVLQRYAERLPAVEINTTFYRSHRPGTYERWAQSTPGDFRFAVKAPRAISHERRLADCSDAVAAFLDEIAPLGDKLGPLLIQLPPGLALDLPTARGFLQDLRRRFSGPVAWEPRHASWFEADGEQLLTDHAVARVAADPARVPQAAAPGGWPNLLYLRLHGSPRMYFSAYGPDQLDRWAGIMRNSAATERWCIFDNTASGAAAGQALDMQARLGL